MIGHLTVSDFQGRALSTFLVAEGGGVQTEIAGKVFRFVLEPGPQAPAGDAKVVDELLDLLSAFRAHRAITAEDLSRADEILAGRGYGPDVVMEWDDE